MNWSRSLRQKAADLFEKGLGYKAVSSELGVNRETVRDWPIPGALLVLKNF